MFLRDAYLVTLRWCLLHACGDVSPLDSADADLIWSAPRMWRCFPPPYQFFSLSWSLLHACGDVSQVNEHLRNSQKSAPRMWRCFWHRLGRCRRYLVCSTHVEMFLPPSASLQTGSRLLHACGDVSSRICFPFASLESAPRMWRCFYPRPPASECVTVCSTHVEMFLSHSSCR